MEKKVNFIKCNWDLLRFTEASFYRYLSEHLKKRALAPEKKSTWKKRAPEKESHVEGKRSVQGAGCDAESNIIHHEIWYTSNITNVWLIPEAVDDHHQVAGNEEVAVDVCGDQLPDQTKITLRRRMMMMMMMMVKKRMLMMLMSVVISFLIKPKSLWGWSGFLKFLLGGFEKTNFLTIHPLKMLPELFFIWFMYNMGELSA